MARVREAETWGPTALSLQGLPGLAVHGDAQVGDAVGKGTGWGGQGLRPGGVAEEPHTGWSEFPAPAQPGVRPSAGACSVGQGMVMRTRPSAPALLLLRGADGGAAPGSRALGFLLGLYLRRVSWALRLLAGTSRPSARSPRTSDTLLPHRCLPWGHSLGFVLCLAVSILARTSLHILPLAEDPDLLSPPTPPSPSWTLLRT